jgi:hypothetical protein
METTSILNLQKNSKTFPQKVVLQVPYNKHSKDKNPKGIPRNVFKAIEQNIDEFIGIIPEYFEYEFCPYIGGGVSAFVWQISDNRVLRFAGDQFNLKDINEDIVHLPDYYKIIDPWSIIVSEKLQEVDDDEFYKWKDDNEDILWRYFDIHLFNVMKDRMGMLKIIDYGCLGDPYPKQYYSDERVYDPITLLA